LSNEFLKPSKTENYSSNNTNLSSTSGNYGYKDEKYYLDIGKTKI
jgi:hypothetical protein